MIYIWYISAVIHISSIYTAVMLLPYCRLYNCLYALSHVHDSRYQWHCADNNHESSHTIPHHSAFASEQNAPSLKVYTSQYANWNNCKTLQTCKCKHLPKYNTNYLPAAYKMNHVQSFSSHRPALLPVLGSPIILSAVSDSRKYTEIKHCCSDMAYLYTLYIRSINN